jgi:HD-GYP domain-containing protein (c-di-GMP phosphodiesterase class II)
MSPREQTTDVGDALHSARVGMLARALARRLGWQRGRALGLGIGGTVHDIGKAAVPRSILGKPGPLTETELTAVRRHPATGARLISSVGTLRFAVPYVLYHHERWDGAGYPTGCARGQIPIEARILAVADAFDAMISDRPYRRALEPEAALAELDRCAGSQFDPLVAETFAESWVRGELPRVDALQGA